MGNGCEKTIQLSHHRHLNQWLFAFARIIERTSFILHMLCPRGTDWVPSKSKPKAQTAKTPVRGKTPVKNKTPLQNKSPLKNGIVRAASSTHSPAISAFPGMFAALDALEKMDIYEDKAFHDHNEGRQSVQQEITAGSTRHPVTSPLAAPQPSRVSAYDPKKMQTRISGCPSSPRNTYSSTLHV